MKTFPAFNHSNRERRLIYFAEETPDDRAIEAVRQINEDPSAIAEAGVLDALKEIRGDVVRQQTFLEKIKSLTLTRDSLTALRQKLGIEIKVADDGKVESAQMQEPAAEVAKPKPKPILGPDGKSIVSTETQTRIQQAGSKLGETIKKFIKALMPLIKSLQKIVNDIKKMIEDIVEDFKYDSSKLATTDKLIDKQIKDPEATDEFLNIHKDNTIREIKAIDKSSDPAVLQSKREKVDFLKRKKEEKLSGASDDPEEQEKITNTYNRMITTAEKVVSDMEAQQRSGKTRRPVLLARLAAINTRMKLSLRDGLDGPSSPSRSTSTSSEGTSEKTAEQKAAEAKEAAEKKTSLEKAQKDAEAAFYNLKGELNMALEENLDEDRIQTQKDAINEALKNIDEDARKSVLEKIGIFTPNSTGGEPTYETTTHNTLNEEAFRIFYEDTVLEVEALNSDTE